MSVNLEELSVLLYNSYESAATRHGWHVTGRRSISWGSVPEEKRASIRDAVGIVEEVIRADERAKHNTEAVQSDLQQIMSALGVNAYARSYSPHDLVQKEILPKIHKLRNTLVRVRDTVGKNYVEVRDLLEEGE